MLRIYLFFSHKSKNAYVAIFAKDEDAKKVAREIKAEALFVETSLVPGVNTLVYGAMPAEIPESAYYARNWDPRWTEISLIESAS